MEYERTNGDVQASPNYYIIVVLYEADSHVVVENTGSIQRLQVSLDTITFQIFTFPCPLVLGE